MTERGPPPDPSYQAHHIVAKKDKRAQDARDILDRYGVSLNDPVNGAWLPANSNSPKANNAVVHSTLHTDNYYDYVETELSGAQSREDVIRVLERVGDELEQGSFAP